MSLTKLRCYHLDKNQYTDRHISILQMTPNCFRAISRQHVGMMTHTVNGENNTIHTVMADHRYFVTSDVYRHFNKVSQSHVQI